MTEADKALRRATMARLSEILRAAATELAGLGASAATFERALLTRSPVLAEMLEEEPHLGPWLLAAERKALRSKRR